jgi:hypothetical protein
MNQSRRHSYDTKGNNKATYQLLFQARHSTFQPLRLLGVRWVVRFEVVRVATARSRWFGGRRHGGKVLQFLGKLSTIQNLSRQRIGLPPARSLDRSIRKTYPSDNFFDAFTGEVFVQ